MSARHPPLALGFYWSPLKVFEYMASGLPVVAPALPRLRELVEDGVEGPTLRAGNADALADALATLADPGRRARLGGAARARAVRDYSWEAHCRALDRRVSRRHALTAVRILLVTDSFPPNCGGSGWSTYELARGSARAGTRDRRSSARVPVIHRTAPAATTVSTSRDRRDRARRPVRPELLQERTTLAAARTRAASIGSARIESTSSTASTC